MSIRRFLVLILISVITLVSFTAAMAGYRASVTKAGRIFDQNLESFAHALSAVEPRSRSGILETHSDIAFQIIEQQAITLRSINAPDRPIQILCNGIGEENFAGLRWRTFCWDDAKNSRRIVAAQPLANRIELAEELALSSLLPLLISTPLLGLIITLAITHSLLPLKKLSLLLRNREANDLHPIVLPGSPQELRPVVSTINRLLTKVSMAFEREKRFASDAAHELRTPISILQVSIHNLKEQYPEISDDLLNLRYGVQRMSHVVEQILLLNRTHPDHFKANFSEVALSDLCQNIIADCYPMIEKKQQNIELMTRNASELMGDTFALSSLLSNLIGNASKYTPPEGDILVSTDRHESKALLIVEDSGPGISEHERERVLDRFYRVGGDKNPGTIAGCGLGMAIVKQVVDLHHGEIQLSRSAKLGGLRVAICFPTQDKAAS
ncbi:MAG: HAMP domain-containing sensor histidine kinase [Pseudomonadales bacterium]